jgi:hypothetical protein
MFRTSILYAKKRALALSVHFKHPDLGMKDYEILSRGTAFLLAVDPIAEGPKGKYSHLEISLNQRKAKLKKQDYAHDPAGGPPRRVQDLGWLEFVPKQCRPEVHVVAASHVLAPWQWKDFYPHDWLQVVRQEHCTYSVEVYEPETGEALAKFALNPYAIHHPQNIDVAIIHIKQEEENLKIMKDIGVEIMHFRDVHKNFEKDEQVVFEGFRIMEEEHITDKTQFEIKPKTDTEDTRIFVPYVASGPLIAATEDRILARTEDPLPEGLCGGPTIDRFGTISGIVEGIVPKDHADKRLAGAASFIPFFRIMQLIEYAERIMIETILPKEVLSSVLELKATGEIGNSSLHPKHSKAEYDKLVALLRTKLNPRDVQTVLQGVRSERDEVLRIFHRDGGELHEIIDRVRTQRMKQILESYQNITSMAEANEEGREPPTDINIPNSDRDLPEAQIVDKVGEESEALKNS